MSDNHSKSIRLNPYDLPAIRRGAQTAAPKLPSQMRQPYTLSASGRLTLDGALTYMEKAYNDGAHYVLHYVTAREAFNLARAAADGKQGDPRQYYDYLIPPYLA